MADPSTEDTDSKVDLGSSFNDPTADVSYTSSDGVVFELHRKHIEVNAPNLPLPDVPSVNDQDGSKNPPIALQESAVVLDILFRFVRASTKDKKTLPPSLSDIIGPVLFEVAEASEKYGVVGALNVCLIHMNQMVTDGRYPLEIVNFSDRHGYEALENAAALLSLSYPYRDLVTKLSGSDLLRRFLLFRDEFANIRDTALSIMDKADCSSSGCQAIISLKLIYLSAVTENLANARSSIPHTAAACVYDLRYATSCKTMIYEKFSNLFDPELSPVKVLSDITLETTL